jgi:cbb3-type cytochrome oxidase maturation protein
VNYALWLVPVGLAMGVVGLLAFLWSMKSGQLEDLDGAAARVLLVEAIDRPLPDDGITGTKNATEPLQDKGKRRSAS